MIRPMMPILQAILVLAVAGPSAGCWLKSRPAPRDEGPQLSDEDPEVAAYFQSKGWRHVRGPRHMDGRPLVWLTVETPDQGYDELVLSPEDFRMIARSKTVQILELRRATVTDDGLRAIAGMSQLEGISVNGEGVTDAGIKALATCRLLDHVSLVRTKKVTDAGVKELAALPKLEVLQLTDLNLDGSAFAAFAGSQTLTEVALDDVDGLTDEGVMHLADLTNLTELTIKTWSHDSKLTTAAIKHIVDVRLPPKFEFDKQLMDDGLFRELVSKGWLYGPPRPGVSKDRPATADQVQWLYLDGSKVTDKEFTAVLDCTNITSLSLDETAITDATLRKLPALTRLDHLSLSKTNVTAAGLAALADLPLKELTLAGCTLSEDSFRAIGRMAWLEKLSLDGAKTKWAGLKHVSSLTLLRELSVARTDFDDDAAKVVAAMPSLERLVVNETRMGTLGFVELVRLPRLKNLYMYGTGVSDDVYRKAKADHPNVSIFFPGHDR